MAKPTIDEAWSTIMETSVTPQELFDRLRSWFYPDEKMQDPAKKFRLNRADGPMAFLGDVIVKKMEKAGYPSVIHCCYRSPEDQTKVFVKGRSKARAFQSPHQYLEAVDIVHKSKFWNVSADYWETLANVVRTVSKEYGVTLEHGHHWRFVDSAHIELADWRSVLERQKKTRDASGDPTMPPNWRPTSDELAERFKQVLPAHF